VDVTEDFYSGQIANINQSQCTRCGKCINICRFDAISLRNKQYIIDPLSCEGCGYCARICPTKAIVNRERLAGQWYISNIKTGSLMVHAKLGIGADNSGKLVAKVKDEAKEIALEERREIVLIDGPPGVGCPVLSSLSGSNYVVLVTEPTVSGLHDLKRVYDLVKKFRIKAGCIINKADVNPAKTAEIKQFLTRENIAHISDLPYDENFTKAMTQGKTIVEFDNGQLKDTLTDSWNKIKQLVND